MYCYPRYMDSLHITARTTAFHISVIIIHIYVMFTYHGYTCMSGFFLRVIWIPVHITCIIVPCCMLYDCFMLLIWIIPLLDMRAVDMRYVESHIYCSRFPLYCSHFPLYYSTLSTELRSCYHVTCIMYCTCSCYIVYLTYQIIKLTWVWGRLDG